MRASRARLEFPLDPATQDATGVASLSHVQLKEEVLDMELRSLRRCVAALALVTTCNAHAATLAGWTFDAADGSFTADPATLAANASVGAWQDLDGTLTSFSGSSGRAIGARSFDNGNSLRVTLGAQGGSFALDELRFDQQASASGPKTWAARINGVLVASGATTTTLTSIVIPLALTGTLFELDFAGSGATSGQGTWRLDNVQLSGTSPVPLPAALPLFACALLGLQRRRLRA